MYFAGYVYCYFYYFNYFQVPLEALDASPQFYWVRAFTALNNRSGIALICLVILTILGYLHRKIPAWIVVIVMIGAFPALFRISYSEATKNAIAKVCHPQNYVRIHFKEDNAKSSDSQAKPTPAAYAGYCGTLKTDRLGNPLEFIMRIGVPISKAQYPSLLTKSNPHKGCSSISLNSASYDEPATEEEIERAKKVAQEVKEAEKKEMELRLKEHCKRHGDDPGCKR